MALLNGDERASLRAARAGSAQGFEALFRSTWPRAFRASYLIVLEHAAAEEIVLESFLGAVRSLDSFGEERPFAPWLHRLVVNRSIDHARARTLQPSGLGRQAEESTAPLEWAAPLGGPHLDRAAFTLAAGLLSLSPDLRGALVVRYLLDYRPGEAAEILDISRSAVTSRLDRALSHLRQRLESEASVDERGLRTLLLQQPVPGEHLAIERTWNVVAAAYGAREPTARSRRFPWGLLTALAALAAIGVAVWLTPAGGWIADRLASEDEPAETLTTIPVSPEVSLPTSGQLLVAGDGEIAVIDPSGVEVPLGDYDAASWEPSGRFIAAWRRNVLVGLDVAEPDTILWQIDRRGIADARWSDDGFRVVYRSRRALRIMDGSGADDRRLAAGVARVAPAWAPGEEHILAYADARGRIRVVAADTRKLQWQAPAPEVVALDWIAPTRLAVLGESELRVLEEPRRVTYSLALPTGVVATALAARPGSEEVAYAALDGTTQTSSVYLVDPGRRAVRLLFAGNGPLRGLVWSPDGRYLLIPWQAANEWLFVPVGSGELSALADPADALGRESVPRVEGWCCVTPPG
jgi:RNA polymerase sigma-70 factor (ECF subfamily)